MGIESNVPDCIFYAGGECRYRGVNRPQLAEFPTRPLSDGELGIDYLGGGFPLRGKGKLVDPDLIRTPLCRGRLHFGDHRGVYQKANCREYASYVPETRLLYET